MKPFAILFLVVLLSACGSSDPDPTSTPVPVPTFTATAEPAILVPTETVAPTNVDPETRSLTETTFADATVPAPALLVPTDTPPVVLTIASPPCDCSGDTLNCSDFKTAKDATMCYDYCMATVGTDVHQLDKDGDGQFCESRR